VLHQNRNFFHLAIWGHEHDCRIIPEASSYRDFFICQPGFPMVISLRNGEAIPKCVGIINIRADTKFKLDPIPLSLQTVRPMQFKTIVITEGVPDRFGHEEVEPGLLEVRGWRDDCWGWNILTGHNKQGTRPMIRLGVEYTDKSQQLNSAMFGNMLMGSVSNAGEILLLNRKTAERENEDR
jgi:double-strand break repair protein MRE11